MKLRADDNVIVIRGRDRGKLGRIVQTLPKSNRVLVEGVNMVYRHVRPTRRNPQGGRVQKEASIHISNVLPFDSPAGKGRRVHFEVDRDKAGRVTDKRRVTTTGTALHTLTRAERSAG